MTLTDIIALLEAAEKPDREIDCHLWVLAKGGDARMHWCDSSEKEFVWERGADGMWIRSVERFNAIPKYTASVDAAISLAERLLPGCTWDISSCAGEVEASVTLGTGRFLISSDVEMYGRSKATAAIALVVAVLRAYPHQIEALKPEPQT